MILVLPFGLSSTPWIFTKMIRYILKQLRSLVVRIVCFLHNGMITEKDYVSAAQCLELVQ